MEERLNQEKQPDFEVENDGEKEVMINQARLEGERLTELKQEKQQEKQAWL